MHGTLLASSLQAPGRRAQLPKWEAARVSGALRDAHWEHDIEFAPSNGTTSKMARFKWVDVS